MTEIIIVVLISGAYGLLVAYVIKTKPRWIVFTWDAIKGVIRPVIMGCVDGLRNAGRAIGRIGDHWPWAP